MAGSGYRIWTPGEVITADNVQDFLQDQTVQVYDSSAARGSALTGYIAEGMISYLKDTDSVEVYNGSAWVGLGGNAPIFTSGTAGQFLKSLGTAGVSWDTIPLPSGATPTAQGIVYGFTSGTAGGNALYGLNAGNALSSGSANVFIGTNAGTAATFSENSVAIGNRALAQATGIQQNTAVGASALTQVTGQQNVAVGAGAGSSITTGNFNTVVGNNAVAGFFGGAVFSGSSNTIIGHNILLAQLSSVTGSNNTLLGRGALPSTNSVSNEITLGDSSITTLRCNTTTISSLSDARDKKDIEDLSVGLDLVNKLRPVEFTWNTRVPEPINLPDGTVIEFDPANYRKDVPDIGFIAQDLQAVEDEFDAHETLQLTLRNNPDRLEATPGRLIPILVKAIQELSAKVEELEAKVN